MVLAQVLTFEFFLARPVWLVPYYTADINRACTSFKFIKYGEDGYDHQFKLPLNLESQRYPCLISICDRDIQSKVSYVQLVRVPDSGQKDNIQARFKATGITADILVSAHRDYLYLIWK